MYSHLRGLTKKLLGTVEIAALDRDEERSRAGAVFVKRDECLSGHIDPHAFCPTLSDSCFYCT